MREAPAILGAFPRRSADHSMSVIYVAGARSGAGATTVACGLAALRRAGGRGAALVKPLSLIDESGDADPAFFASLGGLAATDEKLICTK